MNTRELEYRNRLTRLAVALGACAVALLAGLLASTRLPELGSVVVFGALFAFAENSDVEGPSGIGISAGFMIAVASIVVFATDGAPAGAVAVGLFGVLFIPHMRHGEWRKMLSNAGSYALSLGAGVGVLLALPQQWLDDVPLLLLGATLAAVGVFVVNTLCVGLGMSYVARRPARGVLLALSTRQWLVYPYALVGIGLGWLEVHEGPGVLALAVIPILVGRQAFASYVRLHSAHEATLGTLIQALESKDGYTAGHAERVAGYARIAGEELGLSPKALERLRAAALMHDIGKLIVPNQLLHKPGRLTAEEYERVRRHEDATVDLLGRIDFLAPVAPIAMGVYAPWHEDDHREPIDWHIVAVADAYDAMTSTRSYRRALSQEVAFGELRANSGTQLHPRCVDALIVGVEKRGLHHGAGHESVDAVDAWDIEPPAVGPGSAGLGDLADRERPEPSGVSR